MSAIKKLVWEHANKIDTIEECAFTPFGTYRIFHNTNWADNEWIIEYTFENANQFRMLSSIGCEIWAQQDFESRVKRCLE